MRPHKALPTLTFAVVLVLVAATGSTSAWAQQPTSTSQDHPLEGIIQAAFVQEMSQKAIDGLTDLSRSKAEREAVFRDLLGQVFDIPTIGRFAVGRYWRAAEDEVKLEFLQVFEDVIVQRFLPLFAHYKGEQLIVDGAVPDGRNEKFTIVNSTFIDAKGRKVKIGWRLHDKRGRYQVFDVMVEGVSMAITLRAEYASVIKNAGGLAGLVELLRDKLARGEFEPAVAAQ